MLFESLKEYIKIKSGIKGRSEELELLEQRFNNKVDFLAAFMNLTWPSRLELDPVVLSTACKRLHAEFDVEGFNASVHKNDLMFAFHVNRHKYELEEAVYSYFKVGAGTAKNLKELVKEVQLEPSSILDFGSGYGRVSRFLPFFFRGADVEVSEVKEQAVSFQTEEFGFKGISHQQNPDTFNGGKYDLVLALSVFTHLPEHAFVAWFAKMMNSLNPGGAMVFTFLDQSAGDMQEILKNTTRQTGEFIYIDRSEDKHFSFVADSIKNDQDYGSSFITRNYLEALADNHTGSIHFLDRRLVKAQDAAMIIRK